MPGGGVQKLKDEIVNLVRRRGNNGCLRPDNLKHLYSEEYGRQFEFKRFGYSKLQKFLEDIPVLRLEKTGMHQYLVKLLPQYNSSQSGMASIPEPEPELTTRTTDGSTRFTLIESVNELERIIVSDGIFHDGSTSSSAVAVDCEGVPDNLYLIQVGSKAATYVFDCVKIPPKTVCDKLLPLFSNKTCLKMFHDLHNDALAIPESGGISPSSLCNVLDTQIVLEFLTKEVYGGFNSMLQYFDQQPHPTKKAMKRRMEGSGAEIFGRRPISRDVVQYAADDVSLLIKASSKIFMKCGGKIDKIIVASEQRIYHAAANGGSRALCFDRANNYEFASLELLTHVRPTDCLQPDGLEVHHELEALFDLLPPEMVEILQPHYEYLSDIALDFGEEPIAWVGGKRIPLSPTGATITREDLEAIVTKLGSFGGDNRAGLERQLHRISAIRNLQSEINGLTLRAGRHVTGNTYMITDVLFAHKEKSILFLGEPGSGKTTIVREACRILSQEANLFIVDTSNEIARDGDIKHPCVGQSRRMMVPSLDKQSNVMVECVQNHTPEIMVIDEIGRSMEVEAAKTCKNRGVRLIASAHGDLRSLVKNTKLRGLVGGVQSVTLGDDQAKEEAKKRGGGSIQKTKAERAGPPIFEIICEVKRGSHNSWTIIMDSGEAVDKILGGDEFKIQKRSRNPETGSVHMSLSYG